MKKILLLLLLPLALTAQIKLNNRTVNITAAGDLTYNYFHGAAYVTAANYTPNITQNVPFKITPTFISIEMDGMSMAGDSVTLSNIGDYVITMSMNQSSSAGKDFKVSLYLNGAPYNGSHCFFSTGGANDYGNASWFWYLTTTAATEVVSFYLTGITDNTDLTIKEFKFLIQKQPE